jgi:hypothetical protein
LLRDLPAPVQERLEALCCFEAIDLLRAASAQKSSRKLLGALSALHEGEE